MLEAFTKSRFSLRLCACVLKAKYYLHGDLLKAGIKSGFSYTWQSIIASLQTYKRAHIWRVGSGVTINIWEDHWIPTSHNMVITRHDQVLFKIADELIDPNLKVWDEALIWSIFLPIDAERILRIPLSEHLSKDSVAWHKTKS
jgi:hypothetical protein